MHSKTPLFIPRFGFPLSHHGIFTWWRHYDIVNERRYSFWRRCSLLHCWKHSCY